MSMSLIILYSNTPYDANPLGARPLAHALSCDHMVLYVDPPLSFVTARKQPHLRESLKGEKLTKVHENIYRYIPAVMPGKDRPFVNRLTSWIVRRKVRRVVSEISSRESISGHSIITTAPHYRLFTKDSANNVYWIMDDYISEPALTGISETVLTSGHEWQTNIADHIVAVSDHLAHINKDHTSKISVIPNGVETDVFVQHGFDGDYSHKLFPQLPDQYALYVGGLNNRVDLTYFQTLIQAGVHCVIAGPIDPGWTDRSAFLHLVESPLITYLERVEYKHIPALMYAAGVGLVPYAAGPFNEASLPLKIPEYLSTGLVVVSADLPFVAHFSNDDVVAASSYDDFTQAVIRAFAEAPTPGQRAMRSARILNEWSWKTRAREFQSLLT